MKKIALFLPFFLFSFLIPLVSAHTVTVPTNAYFGFGTGAYINFNTQKTFDIIYRENNYWYLDGYGFQVQNANITITKFFIDKELRFTVTAPTPTESVTQIYVASLGKPSYVSGANATTYDPTTKILKVNVTYVGAKTIIVSWAQELPEPLVPTVNPWNFLQYFFSGDWLGFIQAVWISAFASMDILYIMITLAVSLTIYIRVKSLVLLSIIWILLGTFLISAMPAASGMAVFLLGIGVAALIYQLFTYLRPQLG